MRILFVAMADSVHTARWTGQIADQGWDLHLFPVDVVAPHSALRGVTLHDLHNDLTHGPGAAMSPGAGRLARQRLGRGERALDRLLPRAELRARRLASVIRRLRPDLVQSLEFQHAGYLTLAARRHAGDRFPTWIATNWGSDIQVFGRLAEHAARIREVLRACDYYSAECHRDVLMARELGFRGESLPVLPNAGGLHTDRIAAYRQAGATSARHAITLKGYDYWAGRALVALRGLELAADALDGYELLVYSASPEVRMAAAEKATALRLKWSIVEQSLHSVILSCHGRSRASIGLSIGDGISTSMLEAMAMGSFPIQSSTACADEWVDNGVSALLVDPDDPEQVGEAVRRALTDDALVDTAAEKNAASIASRAEWSVVQAQVVEMYRSLDLSRRGGRSCEC